MRTLNDRFFLEIPKFEGNLKDHLLNQARSETKPEHQVGTDHGYSESRIEQSRLQKELFMRKKKRFGRLRHRMYARWEMKRAELREIQNVLNNYESTNSLYKN